MKLELPQDKKLVHTTTLPIRWGDMDAMGHVNNTLYSATWRSRASSGSHASAARSTPAAKGRSSSMRSAISTSSWSTRATSW
jgi:hypothetical protein